MCVYVCVFFKDTGESSESKYEKKKKIWKREGEREFVFSLMEIIELRVYRRNACHILATILTLHYPIIVTNHPTYIHKKIIKERQETER